MSSPGLPFMPVVSGGPAAPVESNVMGGDLGTKIWTGYAQSPVTTAIVRGWGDITDPTMVSHDDAVARLNADHFDSAFVPKTGITMGALNMEMSRQWTLKENEIRLNRLTETPSGRRTSDITAGLAAGFMDPSNIVLGPLLGEISGLGRGTLAARTAFGAGAGAAYTGAFAAGTAYETGHSEDLGSWQMLHDMTYGAAFFGLTHAAFGPRPTANFGKGVAGGDLTLGDLQGLERSSSASVSKPFFAGSRGGAIGINQIMPETARSYMGQDFDVSTLHDDAVNNHVAQKILDDIKAKFPGDAEAQAVAYNAGIGRAERWIASGRNMKALLPETVKYLERLNKLRGGTAEVAPRGTPAPIEGETPPSTEPTTALASPGYESIPPETERTAAPLSMDDKRALGQVALKQFEADNPVNVAPFHPDPPTNALEAKAQGDAVRAAAPDPQRVAPAPGTPAVPAQAGLATPPDERAIMQRFVTDAKSRVTALKPENAETFDKAIAEAPLEHEPDTKMNHEEFTRTVKAAVQCAVSKGVEIASE